MSELASQLVGGSRRALARAITLIESTRVDHRTEANALLTEVMHHTGSATRVGISGAPGAGKSTLMKCLLGLVRPQRGSVEWFGERLTTSVRRRIGYVPQDLALMYDLSAVDNVRFFGRLYGLRGARLQERVRVALEFVGLWDERAKNPSKYSGGMKRRLNIACGIVHAPDVVIMDEPTAALGVKEGNMVLELIRRVRDKGLPVILISHNMPHVFEIADRIHIQRLGKRAAVVNPKTISMSDTVAVMTGAKAVEELPDSALA